MVQLLCFVIITWEYSCKDHFLMFCKTNWLVRFAQKFLFAVSIGLNTAMFSKDGQFQTHQNAFFVYESKHNKGFMEGWHMRGLPVGKFMKELISCFLSSNVSTCK